MSKPTFFLPSAFRNAALAGLTLFSIVACCILVAPFFPAIIGAVTLAVLLAPVQAWLVKKIGAEGLSAALSVFVATFIVVVPAAMIAASILSEASSGLITVAPRISAHTISDLTTGMPTLQNALQWVLNRADIPSLTTTLTAWLANWSKAIVQTSFAGVLGVLATFYFLFYLLRDQHTFVNLCHGLLPVSRSEFEELSRRFTDTIFATVLGTATVSAIQGGLGALMFWWLGLPAPVFWGVAMAALAVIPFLGAFVIWVPAVAWLVLTGEFTSAALLTIWGIVVVGLVDNLLYPILVGKRLRMHTIPAFIAIVGGVIVLGPAGLIVGPVAFSLSMTLFQIWNRRATSSGELQ